jgi:Family of unknown function (DUF6447)
VLSLSFAHYSAARDFESFFKECIEMTTITIDNKEYELESLSDNAKGQLVSLQFVDGELARLQAQASVLQTARVAYSKALQEALNPTPEGDTIKF